MMALFQLDFLWNRDGPARIFLALERGKNYQKVNCDAYNEILLRQSPLVRYFYYPMVHTNSEIFGLSYSSPHLLLSE
jgi:hypothetical protein